MSASRTAAPPQLGLPGLPEAGHDEAERLRHLLARLYVAFNEYWGGDSCAVLLEDVEAAIEERWREYTDGDPERPTVFDKSENGWWARDPETKP